jgi:hypothetical protein
VINAEDDENLILKDEDTLTASGVGKIVNYSTTGALIYIG